MVCGVVSHVIRVRAMRGRRPCGRGVCTDCMARMGYAYQGAANQDVSPRAHRYHMLVFVSALNRGISTGPMHVMHSCPSARGAWLVDWTARLVCVTN